MSFAQKVGGTVPPLQKVGVRVPPVPPVSYAYDKQIICIDRSAGVVLFKRQQMVSFICV